MLLKACGSNSTGLLSLNHVDDVSAFQDIHLHPSIADLIGADYEIIDLVSSSAHAFLLLETKILGRILLGAGLNTLGQLGSRCALWDDVEPEGRFKVVNLLGEAGLDHNEWKPMRIAVTWTTSFVVYERVSNALNGSSQGDQEEAEQILLSCGSNDFGELGLPAFDNESGKMSVTTPSARPTIVDVGIKPGERVEMLKGGQRHVLAVIDGANGQRMIGWGAARRGELTPGFTSDTARKGKGKGKGVAQPTILPPTEIRFDMPNGVRITDIALGASHTVCSLSDGTVLAWGSDARGQIAGLNEMVGVRAITTTWNGTFLSTGDGIWSQGSNTHSQLLRKEDTTQARGLIPLVEGQVERIVAGTEHLMVLITDGTGTSLWTGGWNEHGNLGLGDQMDRARMTRVDVRRNVRGMWGGCAASWIAVDGM